MALTQNDKNRIAADQLCQITLIHGCVWHQEWEPDVSETLTDWHRKHTTAILQEMSNQ